MRLCRRTLMAIIIVVFGAFPALFIAAPGTLAFCSLIGEDYSGDTNVVAYECDTHEECIEWVEDMSVGLDPDYNWNISCSPVEDSPSDEDNPLGKPPSLIPTPPTQSKHLEAACYAESCEGLDPEGTRCLDDAYTIYSEEVIINSEWSSSKGAGPWGIAEMRYSPTCHSNWVRYTPYIDIDDVIRFVINVGIKSSNDDNGPGGGKGLGTYNGVPYIWRLGVENSLHGPTGSSDPVSWQETKWTSMVSADGDTCWSVEIHWHEDHHAGAGERDHIGTFDADCVS